MKNSTLIFLNRHLGKSLSWSDTVSNVMLDLFESKKLDIDPGHFKLLYDLSSSGKEAAPVEIVCSLSEDQSNYSFTWKIGESVESFSFSTNFVPYSIQDN